MDLDRHLSVIWRFRAVMAGGLLLGLAFAVFAAYHVTWDGGPRFERRGQETWSSSSSVLVTQPGFPWGRVTLPGQPIGSPGSVTIPGPEPKKGDLRYAEPERFANLALLYSLISLSDRVRTRLPEHPKPEQIEAAAVDVNGQVGSYLPVVRLTTKASTGFTARSLNIHMLRAVRDLLRSEQESAATPVKERVELSQLDQPSKAVRLKGYPVLGSMMALVFCLVAALALTHILEAWLPRKSGRRRPIGALRSRWTSPRRIARPRLSDLGGGIGRPVGGGRVQAVRSRRES